jgi:hypothetical protein
MTVELWSSLTPAEQVALLEGHHVTYDAGCDLLDSDDVFVDDISADLVAAGSSVGREIYRTLHGTCRLNLSRELQWGSARLRPFTLVSGDGVTFYRQDRGIFLPSTPERPIGTTPAVFSVECFDKLDVLNTPHGRSYSIAAGVNVVEAMTALITEAGESKISIAPSDAVTASVRAMSIVDEWSTLGIINNLAESIGYRPLSSSVDGFYTSVPQTATAELATVWSYSTSSKTTTVAEDRLSILEYYGAANTVVAINDDVSLDVPVDGVGIFTVVNQSDGPTSIDARGKRTIRRVIRGEYASQAALETAAQTALDAEKRVTTRLDISVLPNVHGHFDVVSFRDDAIPVNGRFVVTGWELPLDGGDMRLSLRGV